MARAASTAKETVAGRPPPPALRPEDDLEDDALDADESPLRDGRNENSLAYLCQRFCEMYQNHSEPINIDLAAKELGIQRRRMYEILNIIQSVGLVGRLRASFYRWDGYDKMTVALERLKEEGLARLAMASRSSSTSTAASGNPGCMSPENQRRKAVATALGERFVQIFLCNEVPQPVILEDIMGLFASCVGGANAASALTNQTSCARRLYDIANVFCSIGLVRKSCAPATDNRRKKRLYDWIGPVPTATTTPLRPARLTLTAPTASPGSGSAKRVKREPNSALDTPRGNPLRKKSRLTSGGIDLEASIRRADEEAEHHELKAAVPKTNVLQHPAVVSLRGTKAGLTGPPSLQSGERKPGGADKTRAMLVARSLDTPSTAAAALSSLASVSAKASAAASLFNPPNAKERSLSPFTARGGMKLSSSSAVSTANVLSSLSTSSSSPSPISPTTKCSCGSSASSSSSSPSSPSSESPAVLKAQIDQLKKELHDARLREQELLRRVESQDAQIKSLAKSSSSSSSFLLSNSPLTNLAFSPFPGSLARDAFSSLTASPSPFQSSTGSFFSPGSAPKSGRPPFKRRAARVGPQIVDPTGDVDTDLLPAASPHLSPGTTSIASSLLLSPSLGAALSDKENRLVAAARQGEQLQLLSPVRVRTIKAEAAPPSTPPHCQLLATAASSLLSLTPSQVPTFSPSIQRIFANDASDSELEPEGDDATGGSLFTTIKMELADEPSNNQDEQNQEHDDARANTASPEPCVVRTPASLAAPSSPSPSAKNIKTRHALAPHTHCKITASSSTSSTSSSSPSSTPPTSSSALVASLEEFSSLASSRVTGCLS